MLIKKVLTRRQILSRVGGGAAVSALAPFVPLVEAAEGDGSPKRFTYWHEFTMPGTDIVNGNYQTDYGPLQFKNDFTPLNAIAEKIIFMRNISRPQGEIVQQGPHPFGAMGISGWRGTGRRVWDDRATSVDQFVAQKLVGKTPFKDLRAGFRNQGNQGIVDISTSVVNGKPQPRYQSPVAMFNEIFKDAKNGNSEAAINAIRQRRSLLDFMKEDIKKIKARVSHFDQNRIDAHSESVRQTELTIEAELRNQQNNTECTTAAPAGGAFGNENQAYPVYSRLISQALACDLTRVAGMTYGSTTSNLRYSFLPGYRSGTWHQATHGKANGVPYQHQVLNFRAKEITRFLEAMDSFTDPDGNTVLDNTIFHHSTDVARNHNTKDDVLMIMAGGKGRFKGQGQMVNSGANNNYNQLMSAWIHYMGFEVEGYGDPNYTGKGILSSDLFT